MIHFWRRQNAGKPCSLSCSQIPGFRIEIVFRRVVDTKNAGAELGQIEVELENPLFRDGNVMLDEIDEIEKLGGLVEAVDTGWLHRRAARFIEREQQMIEDGQIKVVGRNYFRDPNLKTPDIWVQEYDDSIGQAMRDKLANLRMRRDNEKATAAINALKAACKRGDNVMAACLECARADVTEGEMRRAFTDAFGMWKSPIFV